MGSIVSKIRTTLHAKAAYRRTVREIRNMPVDTALDLDMYRGDAKRIARKAVYGR